jgi:hypothetical protein
LFVHGTGVREARHAVVFDRIRQGFGRQRPGLTIESCYWGDAHGATLAAGGASIPSLRGDRPDGNTGDDPDTQLINYWNTLLDDPLAQLRFMAETGDSASDEVLPPNAHLPSDDVLARLSALPPTGELGVLLAEAGLADHFEAARERLRTAPELDQAAAAFADGPAEFGDAVACALLALMLDAADEPILTSAQQNRLADLLAAELGAAQRAGVISRSFAYLAASTLNSTTEPFLRFFRTRLTNKSAPAIGDILHYQAHGEGLRGFLRERILDSGEETIVVGHSLGGVALVDLLASAQPGELSQVRLLVTVGSQAPFLYELGALHSMPPDVGGLPGHMPRWLNIFDRRDLLAYLAAPVFGQGAAGRSTDAGARRPGVEDFEVSSGQPFPLSHSAYWRLDSVYERICREIA